MRFVSWAAYYEGASDALYFDVLLPRMVRDIVARDGSQLVEVPDVPVARVGVRNRSVQAVAAEVCALRDAIDIWFIHADTGGRAQERNLAERSDAYCLAAQERCAWLPQQCIVVAPRHEMEAWLIADGAAVASALGYAGSPTELGLPVSAANAEKERDPKAVFGSAIVAVSGSRRRQSQSNLYAAVAQRQRLEVLRQSNSFRKLEAKLQDCLSYLGCI